MYIKFRTKASIVILQSVTKNERHYILVPYYSNQSYDAEKKDEVILMFSNDFNAQSDFGNFFCHEKAGLFLNHSYF